MQTHTIGNQNRLNPFKNSHHRLCLWMGALLGILILSACAQTHQVPAPAPVFTPPIDKIDYAKQCRDTGGVLGQGGRGGRPVCFQHLPDAGKPCTDTSQCQGACIALAEPNPNTPAKRHSMKTKAPGQCQETMPLFGCHTVLQSGSQAVMRCVD